MDSSWRLGFWFSTWSLPSSCCGHRVWDSRDGSGGKGGSLLSWPSVRQPAPRGCHPPDDGPRPQGSWQCPSRREEGRSLHYLYVTRDSESGFCCHHPDGSKAEQPRLLTGGLSMHWECPRLGYTSSLGSHFQGGLRWGTEAWPSCPKSGHPRRPPRHRAKPAPQHSSPSLDHSGSSLHTALPFSPHPVERDTSVTVFCR